MKMSLPALVAAGAVAALLGACAAGSQAPAAGEAPYQLLGVNVARPGGDWQVAAYTPSALILRKTAPAMAQWAGSPAASVAMGVTTVSAAHLDLRSPEGQRRAVEAMLVAAETARYHISELKFQPHRHRGAECVAYDAVVEERTEDQSGPIVLVLTNHGFLCRHPDSLTYYVAGAFSERRTRDGRPLLDAPLRAEAMRFLDSIRFTSL
jgi:hypothetical protein